LQLTVIIVNINLIFATIFNNEKLVQKSIRGRIVYKSSVCSRKTASQYSTA